MKTPKLTLFFTFILIVLLLTQDLLMHVGSKPLELLQNLAFVCFGGLFGLFYTKLSKVKTTLINSEKLAQEVEEDEKKQLQAKVKTLEAALEKLMK